MAENSEQESTVELNEIPVLQERIMTGISSDGFTSSYRISNSYAGILRISPNSAATLIDKNDIGIESNELSEYINYSDNPTLLMSKQFLPVSSSDGVMLNMRFFQNAVEYDTLYVIGQVKTYRLEAFNNGENKFKINNCELPNYFNRKASSDDAEFIIVNTKKTSPKFEYASTKELISILVKQALLARGSLPTGSIHFIPVTLKQYETLLNADGNGHNINESHPLIRDFLLCDGSLYQNKDYPELAKILYKEHITYWAPEGDTMVRHEIENNYSDKDKTFRVPDLRSMFIRATIPQIECLSKPDSYPLFKDTGYWQIDSSKNQEIIRDKIEDKHYHYIVLDNKTKYITPTPNNLTGAHNYNANTRSWDNNKMEFPIIEENVGSIDGYDISKGPLPLAKFGNTYHVPGSGSTGYTSFNLCYNQCKPNWCLYGGGREGGPFSVVFWPRNLNYFTGLAGCMGADKTCGYVLCSDYSNIEKSLTLDDYVGRSSWNIDMSVKNDENWASNIKENSYKNDEFIVKTENKEFMNLENAPEFYACLPFIKI